MSGCIKEKCDAITTRHLCAVVDAVKSFYREACPKNSFGYSSIARLS
jgi:hypothetical protein